MLTGRPALPILEQSIYHKTVASFLNSIICLVFILDVEAVCIRISMFLKCGIVCAIAPP